MAAIRIFIPETVIDIGGVLRARRNSIVGDKQFPSRSSPPSKVRDAAHIVIYRSKEQRALVHQVRH